MNQAEQDARDRAERGRQVALFRYRIISEVADPSLSGRQRAEKIRALAAIEHDGPGGVKTRVSRPTVERWVRTWRERGFEGLIPPPARVEPRTPAEVPRRGG